MDLDMRILHFTKRVNVVGEQPPVLLLLHPAGLELQPLFQHVPQALHLPLVAWQAGPGLPGRPH